MTPMAQRTTRPLLRNPLSVLGRRRTILLVHALLRLWVAPRTSTTSAPRPTGRALRRRWLETGNMRIQGTEPLTWVDTRRLRGANPRRGFIARRPHTIDLGGMKGGTLSLPDDDEVATK